MAGRPSTLRPFCAHRAALTAGLALIAMILPVASPASAAFPGHNGKIYFTRVHRQRSQIYRVNPDGTHRQQLTSGRGWNYSPSPSPNGKTIAFVRQRHGTSDIFLMRANGTQVRRLIKGPAAEFVPRFSPNGMRLLFESCTRRHCDLFRMRLKDKRLVRATRLGSTGRPSWSPDGTTIAYPSPAGHSNVEIWRSDALGGHTHRLTHGRSYNYDPDYSPTGDRIVFTGRSTDPSSRYHLSLMNADGSDPERISSPHASRHGRQQLWPSYSPDGEWIVFWEYPVPSPSASDNRVVMIHPDGSGRHVVPHTAFGLEPTWAPQIRR